MAKADVSCFRPNFVIDEEYDEPFCEDEFLEIRIANVMMRQVGPRRCNEALSLLWGTKMRHPNKEPFKTLNVVRKHH